MGRGTEPSRNKSRKLRRAHVSAKTLPIIASEQNSMSPPREPQPEPTLKYPPCSALSLRLSARDAHSALTSVSRMWESKHCMIQRTQCMDIAGTGTLILQLAVGGSYCAVDLYW